MPTSDSGHSTTASEHSSDSASTRPALTVDEVAIVKNISTLFKETDSPVCCSGYALLGFNPPTITYTSNTSTFATDESSQKRQKTERVLALRSSDLAEYTAFHAACFPAHYGHATELVYDETYRLAREILPGSFELNFNPLEPSYGIISTIEAVFGIRARTELYKINSYCSGGLFRPHKDTPRGEDHIGTLVIALPSPFEGGHLILRHGSFENVIDWSTLGRGDRPDDLHWVFFYSDIEHEVRPVTSGYRLTVSYNVYGYRVPRRADISSSPWYAADGDTADEEDREGQREAAQAKERNSYKAAIAKVDPVWRLSPLFSAFVDAYRNRNFLPNGGRLAFGLDHEYGFAGRENSLETFDWCLKGRDGALLATVEAMGLSYELKAIYEVEVDRSGGFIQEPWPPNEDEFSTHRTGTYLVLCDRFEGVEVDEEHGQRLEEELLQVAEADFTLVWVHYPMRYEKACDYIAYGNEPSNETLYVAAALIVDIPRFGTHRRHSAFP